MSQYYWEGQDRWSRPPSENGLPGISVPPGATIFASYWLSGFGLISDGMVGLFIYFGRMNLSVNQQTPMQGISPTENAQAEPLLWFFPSRSIFLKIFLMGLFSWSRNPTVIKNLSSLHDHENQGQTPFCMTFIISGCKHDTNSTLGVDSNIFVVENIKNVRRNHVTLTVDLGTQGHAHPVYDLF